MRAAGAARRAVCGPMTATLRHAARRRYGPRAPLPLRCTAFACPLIARELPPHPGFRPVLWPGRAAECGERKHGECGEGKMANLASMATAAPEQRRSRG